MGGQLLNLGINVMRILHGEEEYEYLAPIYPGETLTGVMTLVDGKTREGKGGSSMDILTTEVRYTSASNQHVLTTRTVIVVRN
jgi:acyl dehydratase